MKKSRAVLWVVLLLAGIAAACSSEDTPQDAVHVMTANGVVGPIMDRFIDRGIERAEDNRGKVIVIEMDTPGGLSSSMESIVKRILNSSVPVVLYVTPPGGRAASAGTFIAMAAHVAVMAPNTRIGAASAVNADGGDIEGALGRKIENDAVALIRALAEERGRNVEWAESAVRDATADQANDAAELRVVDFVANDIEEILARLDGTSISLRPGTTVEMTGLVDAEVVRTELTVWERILMVLANPTLASILISLGFLGIIFELSSPGTFIPGTAGVIAIILGFIGFGALPVETAGLVLIGLALVLIALELFVPSGGVLGIGGVVALIIGGIIAFRDTPTDFQPNRIVVGVLIFLLAGMFISITLGLARMRKMERPIGTQALIGQTAVVRTPLAPDGFVFIDGERWRAKIDHGMAGVGERLRVTGVEGFTLHVRKEVEDDPGGQATIT